MRIQKLVAETEPVFSHARRVFELLRYNNKLFFDMLRYDFDKEDYLTDARIDRDTPAQSVAETHRVGVAPGGHRGHRRPLPRRGRYALPWWP